MKLRYIITLFTFVTCCIGTSKPVFNLLKNGNFEYTLAQEWEIKKIPGVKIFSDSLVKYSGNYCITIENHTLDNTYYHGCNQTLLSPPADTWLNLSIAIKVYRLSGRAGIDLHFRDEENKRIQTHSASIVLQENNLNKNWQVYTRDIIIPKGTKTILVALFIKGQGTAWFDDVNLSTIETDTSKSKQPSIGAFILEASNPIVWFEYADHKVFKETPVPRTKRKQEIEIAGAQNEWEAFQFVIHPKSDLKDCHIQFKDLISKDGHRIEKEHLSYYQVGYVNIEQASAPNGVTGFNPDYLIKDKYFDLNKRENNPIWIDLYIPERTKPGGYHGEILLEKGNKPLVRIPLHVEVWDFQLPGKSHLYIKSHFDFGLIRNFDNRKPSDILADYYENLSEHRVNIMDIPGPLAIIDGNEIKCLFEKFDDTVTELFEKYGYEAVTIGPFLGDATGWTYRLEWLGIDIESEKFKRYFKQYCRQLEEHLEKKGWLDRCYIYYWDEPQIAEPNFDKIIDIGKTIKESAPNLKIFITKWPIADLHNIVDIWCLPFSSVYFDQEKISHRQRLGEKVFVYYNDPYIDTPLIDKRLYAWRYLKAGVDGVFTWWNITKWLDNPYDNPHITLPRNDGSKYPLKPGNGVLLYPNQDGSGPPVNSVRWEIFRQGLEDYEYLWLLKQNIRQALTHVQTNTLFVDFARFRIHDIINTIVEDQFTPGKGDVNYLYEIRKRIAEDIQNVNKRPTVLIRTIPHSGELSFNEQVRIFGITEKSTKILINGISVSVKSDGSFSTDVNILREGYILVKASLDNKEKTIKHFIK